MKTVRSVLADLKGHSLLEKILAVMVIALAPRFKRLGPYLERAYYHVAGIRTQNQEETRE